MNSIFLIAITWLRTMRAIVSHSTAPIATNNRMIFRPKNTISRITKMAKGREYMMSTARIMKASSLPPKNPATAP
jgi:hypothetical protein